MIIIDNILNSFWLEKIQNHEKKFLVLKREIFLSDGLLNGRTFNPFLVDSIAARSTKLFIKNNGLQYIEAHFFIKHFNADQICDF